MENDSFLNYKFHSKPLELGKPGLDTGQFPDDPVFILADCSIERCLLLSKPVDRTCSPTARNWWPCTPSYLGSPAAPMFQLLSEAAGLEGA